MLTTGTSKAAKVVRVGTIAPLFGQGSDRSCHGRVGHIDEPTRDFLGRQSRAVLTIDVVRQLAHLLADDVDIEWHVLSRTKD